MIGTVSNPRPIRNFATGFPFLFTLLILGLCLAGAAPAAASALNDFNLIALGSLTGTSEVEGRVVVFGDVYGDSSRNFAVDSNAVSDAVDTEGLNQNDGLIVGGEVRGASIQVNNGGVRIGKSSTGTDINNADSVNVDSVVYEDASVQNLLDSVMVEINDTVAMLNGLTTNSYVDTSDMNRAEFNVTAEDDSIAVFDISSDFFNQGSTMDLTGDLSAVDLIVIRVEGDSIAASGGLNTKTNEFGLDEYQEKIIWYFPDATDLAFVNGLGGAVIAPNADLTFGNPIEGTVVVNNIVLGSEIHLPSLDSPALDTPAPDPVPEPGTLLLLGLGLLVVLAAGRRPLAPASRPCPRIPAFY